MADKYRWSSRKDGISPGSMKSISQTKLKAFSVGQMNVGKKLSKRAEEEQKKKNQEKETAKVFEEFVASFEDVGATQKTFVRGSVINPETREERAPDRKGALYRPSSKISESIAAKRAERERREREREAQKERERERKPDRPDIAKKKKEQSKAKSNLEIFKEELKILQAEREERHRVKRQMHEARGEPLGGSSPPSPPPASADVRVPRHRHGYSDDMSRSRQLYDYIPVGMEDYAVGSHDFGDPSTTNIFLGSINPKMNEEMLCEEFGKYGPLASVKIMWPRTDEERARNRNCGFVAFMNRKDAERALKALNGREIMNFEMKLGWGKAVPLPPHPVYIPPAMLELTMPPPPSGLPFNAQPKDKNSIPKRPPPGMFMDELDDETKKTADIDSTEHGEICTRQVKKPLLQVIHRMIEFVVREGPMFEAMVMNRELSNPMYRFLFENHSPAHVYYRWKLFSVLQGESPNRWRTQEFRMFKSGSIWRPPPINPYLHGMPDELAPKGEEPRKGQLSNNQRDKLEDMLRGINLERDKIGEAMVYCLDHAESAEEIVDCIAESLSILQTPIPKKIGRFFLVSDILFNSSAKVVNASYFRKYFENKMPEICQDLLEAHKNIQQRLKAEQFKQKVISCFRLWDEWAIYPSEFVVRLQNVFLGLQSMEDAMRKEDPPLVTPETLPLKPRSVDLDGAPIEFDKINSDNDKLDGDPLDGQPLGGPGDLDGMLLKGADFDGVPLEENSDIDGAPLKDEKDDLDGMPIKDERPKPGFKMAPSKWESVDTSLLEEQAMTTSKWELLEEDKQEKERNEEDDDDDLSTIKDDEDSTMFSESSSSMKSAEMTEERRAKLREIELKVMKFQDDVEGGRRSRKHGMSITEQVAKYRAKLLQKEKDKEIDKKREKEKERNLEKERERLRDYERARERERDRLGRDSDESEDDSPAPKRRRRRSHSRSLSPPMGKRNRSESSSPASERRSRRSSIERERSPLSAIREYSDSPAHRSHRSRSGSPKKSGRTFRMHRSRSRSPRRSRRSRSKSPHRSRSHKKKRKL